VVGARLTDVQDLEGGGNPEKRGKGQKRLFEGGGRGRPSVQKDEKGNP